MKNTAEVFATHNAETIKIYHYSGKKWLRLLLLSILGYEAAGCLAGGTTLMAAPDGRLMDMPVNLMRGAFPDFLVPGIILFGLGLLSTYAFVKLLRKAPEAWIACGLALGGLTIWFWVEIAILQVMHWLHLMWGVPVIVGIFAALPLVPTRQMLRNGLLMAGIIASLLYAFICAFVAMQWREYSSASQTVSELSAIGAPTRILWLVLSTAYIALMIAFSIGVWNSAGKNKFLRMTGGLLLTYSALGVLWPLAPMHLRETLAVGGTTWTDSMHLALGVLTEVIYITALLFAAAAFGRVFRLYSFATLGLLLTFGLLTFIDAPGVAAGRPTPFIGIWERVNIGLFLLWLIVLATILLREKTPQEYQTL